MACPSYHHVQIQHYETRLAHLHKENLVAKVNSSPVQSLLWFLSCWKCFTSPEPQSGMDKDRQISLFDAAPHYTDLFSAPVLTQPLREQELWWCCLLQNSITYQRQQSLREQLIEDHLPSTQKAPPEIPVENWEQVGISKQHHNISKHRAKNAAAHRIWYSSSRKQVWKKTMQQDITPGKAGREQCCILSLLRFFSAIASQWQALPVPFPSSPMLRWCHCPCPGWGQAPEGQAGSSSAHWPVAMGTGFCYN